MKFEVKTAIGGVEKKKLVVEDKDMENAELIIVSETDDKTLASITVSRDAIKRIAKTW